MENGDIDGESASTQAAAVAKRWQTNQWLKKAVLLSFRLSENRISGGNDGGGRFYDKVPLKYENFGAAEFLSSGARVVPGAVVRRGSYIAPKVVLMPAFVNIGAYIGEGAMIDTWATVGSCAQIGAGVHLSGGAGIGGVLEPLQASPTIVEDDCFIGARSEVVEGAIIGKGSVLAMGVFIGKSTRIYDRQSGEVFYGAVPPYSVVVPGTLPSKDGSYALACAIIVKRVDAKTRAKTALNDLLRPDMQENVISVEEDLFLDSQKGFEARGRITDAGFLVYESSQAAQQESQLLSGAYSHLTGALTTIRTNLKKDGTLVADGDFYRFARDYTFSSSSMMAASMAASAILGHGADGLERWKNAEGQTLKELQTQKT